MITKLNKKSVVLQNLSLQSGAAFLSYDELASLAKLQERLMDENDVHNFITRSAQAWAVMLWLSSKWHAVMSTE